MLPASRAGAITTLQHNLVVGLLLEHDWTVDMVLC
jgi:hypothetical protein